MRFLSVSSCNFVAMLVLSGAVTAALAGEGEVISTMDSAGYTYIEVRHDGKTDWLASEPVKVSVGQRIKFEEFSLMTNFRSESLMRTFTSMRFVNEVKVLTAALAPAASSPVNTK